MEKQLKKVTFLFEDGTEKILAGEELEIWEGICYAYSDYLLPGGTDYVLATGYMGLVRGFVPGKAVGAV